jgi:putative glycosyltransferase (TIGR04372 family)
MENRLLVRMVRGVQACTKWSDVWINLKMYCNEYDEFNNIPQQLSFTPEEESKGEELLRLIGVEPGSRFVCFHARDARGDNVHEFQNSSIYNYLPAAEYLASQGLYALRLGLNVAEKIKVANDRIINYAEEFGSDFGNVYLVAKCKFLLICTSGPYGVGLTFGVPIAEVNTAPMNNVPIRKNDLFIPKKLWSIKEKRFLAFPAIVDNGIDSLMKNFQYTQAGIEVIENTSDEVLALAKEMNARLDGTWVTTEEDEYLQQRYRDLFPPGHFCYGFPSRIGAEFLRQNRALLE